MSWQDGNVRDIGQIVRVLGEPENKEAILEKRITDLEQELSELRGELFFVKLTLENMDS